MLARSSRAAWATTSTLSSFSRSRSISTGSARLLTPISPDEMPTIMPTGPKRCCIPSPALIVARAGGFESWMRRRGKLGGQNKVPRMDNSGNLTRELVGFLRQTGQIGFEVPSGAASNG